jgi:hypothetical protein
MAGSDPSGSGGARLAAVLTVGWLGLLGAIAWQLQGKGVELAQAAAVAAVVLAVALPVALVWLAAGIGQMRATLQAEIVAQGVRLQDGLAAAAAARAQGPQPSQTVSALEPVETGLARFVSRREAALADVDLGQTGLPLEPPRAALPLGRDEVIQALDFPRDAADAPGFDLLRRALHDPALSDLIRAAEAVLSGLVAEGIEVRDLRPDRARPEVWRAFAQGARGAGVAGLGGIRDRAVLVRAAARMRADPAFREAAHRFLRGFDLRLAALEPGASDAQIVRLAETRAARAFMILGRVAGMFG